MLNMSKGTHLNILTGCVLGDGYIREGRTKLEINHGAEQHEYALFKAELLSKYHQYPYKVNIGYRPNKKYQKWYPYTQVIFDCGEKIKRLHRRIYVNRKQTLSLAVLQQLNPIGLAIWYMDNGGARVTQRGSRNLEWCTDRFSEEEHKLFQRWLQYKYKIFTRITPRQGKYFRIEMNAKNMLRFFDIIGPYVPPCMNYKLDMKYVRKSQPKYEMKGIVRSAWKQAEKLPKGLPLGSISFKDFEKNNPLGNMKSVTLI